MDKRKTVLPLLNVLQFLCCVFGENDTVDLYIMGLLPFGGSWPGGEPLRLAINMGIEKVNEEQILPGYKLNFIYENSQCDIGTSINSMYKLFYNKPAKLVLLGPICSHSCEVTAQAGSLWNVTQISPACATPTLSDKLKYPYFMRVNGPDQLANSARIAFLKKHRWYKIATIHETVTLFSLVVSDLQRRCKEENITTIRSETVTHDVSYQVNNLKKYAARIIFIFTYEKLGRKILCEAYKIGLIGSRYVYIYPSWWADRWWIEEGNATTSCTEKELMEAANLTFAIGNLFANPFETVGLANMTGAEFERAYLEYANYTEKPFGMMVVPNSYDGIWTIALGLKAAEERMKKEGWNRTLADFHYSDTAMSRMILEEMKAVDFIGIRGRVKFTPEGDCYSLGAIAQRQHIGGTLKPVRMMVYVPATEDSPDRTVYTGNRIIWKGGKPPRDSLTVKIYYVHTSLAIYSVMTFFAIAGISVALFFLCFNLYHRQKRIIKMSSPNMNNCILVGCILMYFTVAFTDIGLDESMTAKSIRICKLPTFLACSGFSIAFGALFSKTYRVHRIFINKNLKRRIVKDIHLFAMVFAFLGINFVLLIIWEIISPQRTILRDLSTQVIDEDTEIVNKVHVCYSPLSMYFMSVIYGIQGILLLFGAFLSWETRKVKIPELNDSKQIGLCVYNVIILSLLAVGMSFALESRVNIIYIVQAACILVGTTLTQVIIFVPKVMMMVTGTVSPEDLSEGSVGTVTASISAGGAGASGS